MQPRKLNLHIGVPCYGGNGGIASIHPDVAEWFARTIMWAKSEPRIGEVTHHFLADTPITMSRNAFVKEARQLGADLLLCCDSDQAPFFHMEEPDYKPFVQSSFDFLYRRYDAGPVVVVAPYRGNPPHENMFVFYWEPTSGDYGDEMTCKLEQYTRNEAARLRGIQECAAGPTGMILYDLRAFDLIEPKQMSKREILLAVQAGKMDVAAAERSLSEGWFYYQWKDGYGTEKASTEDVTFTRDISIAGQMKLGYNPLFCNWDSPVGHWKPYCVPGRPKLLAVEQIAENFQRTVLEDRRIGQSQVEASELCKGWEDQIAGQAPKKPTFKIEQPSNGKPVNYWGPWREATIVAEQAAEGCRVVVDISHGKCPFSKATEFVGRRHPEGRYGSKPFHELDLNCDRLPYDDQSVDFVYCRHVLEDLDNPGWLLKEITRVAKAGYIETPSPICENTYGVDAPGSRTQGRGYSHHRSIIWTFKDVLYVLPKLPAWETLGTPDNSKYLNEGETFWNTCHLWKGPLKWRKYEHEIDFNLATNERYLDLAVMALHQSHASSLKFIGAKFDMPGPATCPEHIKALSDLLREHSICQGRKLRVLEVGTWHGDSAFAMYDTGCVEKMLCVDNWQGADSDALSSITEWHDALKVFTDGVGDRRIDWTCGDANEVLPELWGGNARCFDFIHIDADHSYDAVKSNIEDCWKLLADDGVMVGHDYGTIQFPGTSRAVDERFGKFVKTAFGGKGWGYWYVHKDEVEEPCLTN